MNYRKKKTQTKDTKTKRRHTERETGPPVVTVDYEYFSRYLCEYDISDEQKRELIGVWANIMMAFVDLGFGVAPGQIPCEADDIFAKFLSDHPGNLLHSGNLPDTTNDENVSALCAAEEDDS